MESRNTEIVNKNMMEKHVKVLIDFSQILAAGYMGRHDAVMNEGLLLKDLHNDVRKYVLTKIIRYCDLFGVGLSDIILCSDSPDPWRIDKFPYYKAKRKSMKRESHIDYGAMLEFYEQFAYELRVFPFIDVKVDRCEGDDIIAVLSRHINDKIVIVTSDKDMLQLIRDGVRVFNPRTETLVEQYKVKSGKNEIIFDVTTESEAKKILAAMILKGDDSDGIPNVKSDDDAFINPTKKQSVFGWGEISKKYYHDEDAKRNFNMLLHEYESNMKRNIELIDLRRIPLDITTKIKNEYESISASKTYNVESINEYFDRFFFAELKADYKAMLKNKLF